MTQLAAYYPHQEFAEATTDGYLFDMRRLVERYGLAMVRDALLSIRIRPGQKFFPHPTEVAQELQAMAEIARAQHLKSHPYVECAAETHYSGGLVMRFDKDGNREMRECECKKRWREEHQQPKTEAK